MRCPKYWSFSFSAIPSKEIPGLIHPLKRAVETASINPLIFHQEALLLDDKSQENENSELGQKKRTRQDHALLKRLGVAFGWPRAEASCKCQVSKELEEVYAALVKGSRWGPSCVHLAKG